MKNKQLDELARFYLAASEHGQRAIMALARGEAMREGAREAAREEKLALERAKKRKALGLVVVSDRTVSSDRRVGQQVPDEVENYRATFSR